MFLLVKGAKIIDPPSKHHGQNLDLIIRDGKILDIGKDLKADAAKKLEVPDLHLSVGWTDIGLQIGDPGFEHREDLQSASLAAAKGGYTAIAPFPNTNPVIHSKTELNYWIKGGREGLVDILPIGALTMNCNGKDLSEMIDMFYAGAIAFSDGKESTQDNGMLLRALQYVKSFDGIVINHPHDKSLSGGGHMHEGYTSTTLGLKGISHLAEEMMVIRDISLAQYADSKLHIHGISTAGSVDLIRQAKKKGARLSCSVAAMNLIFEDSDLSDFNPYFKVLPPLRTKQDRMALLEGLKDGTIDMIISNHDPLEEERKKLEFSYADFGAIGLESTYALLNTHLSIEQDKLISFLAIQARKIFGLEQFRIEKGELANLCFFLPNKEWTLETSHLGSKSRNTPLLKKKLKGMVLGIINGNQSHFSGLM